MSEDEKSPEEKSLPASVQMRNEIHAIIYRYGQESDVTAYQTIGVLEVVKADIIEMLDQK